MKPIIKVENLSKQYKLGTRGATYTTMRDAVSGIVRAPRGMISKNRLNEENFFWALRDVNFEVERGEIVGIIGRNGAGKSTLLKILAQVTEPTTGRIELYGNANSLLEVGTGFHPELTGRENIFVNGAILGMKKAEIKCLFDEIVEFAEIEKFLDTAVKHYSSGMYMRLAFSVAAHLNPDILIIDEVLSVGDAQFQKKCLGKVQDVASAGRTVLFVSHNMAAVENLCERGIVLEKGEIIFAGQKTQAISKYLESVNKNTGYNLSERPDRIGTGEIYITQIEIRDLMGNITDDVMSGQDIDIYFHFETTPNYRQSNVSMCLMVRTHLDMPVFLQHNKLVNDNWDFLPHAGAFVCRLRKLPLAPASYRWGYSVMCGDEYLDRIDDLNQINVIEGDFYGSGKLPSASHGCILVDAEWRVSDKN